MRGLAASCARTRFRIALASLHNDTAAQCVLELLDAAQDGSTPAGSGRPALADLATALDEGLHEAAAQSAHNAELAGRFAEQRAAVRDLVLVLQGLLGNWQQGVASRRDEQVQQLQRVLAERLADGDRTCVALTELVEHCLASATTRSADEFTGPIPDVPRLAEAPTPTTRRLLRRRVLRLVLREGSWRNDQAAFPRLRGVPDAVSRDEFPRSKHLARQSFLALHGAVVSPPVCMSPGVPLM